jgi:hypothetical protein
MKYLFALSAGFILAIVFHWLLGITRSEVVVYAALPGLVAHLWITGGHGGTITEERFGSILEVAVNAITYGVLLLGLSMLVRKLRQFKVPN